MPTIELDASPHAPGIHPVKIHYREYGNGEPLLFLHSGWGYGVYPFDRQTEAFEKQYHIVIPDRTGYGHSTRVTEEMPLDFHRRAAMETAAVMQRLGIQKAILWGHSDGAAIAAILGLRYPEQCQCLILEATHFLKRKPGSRAFFERFAARPEELDGGVRSTLAEDHGEEQWKNVVQRNCEVWIRIAGCAARPEEDLYEGRLSELSLPTLFVHGRFDPRTEPGEMDLVREAVPRAAFRLIENGRHSPHSEEAAFKKCSEVVQEFLTRLRYSTR